MLEGGNRWVVLGAGCDRPGGISFHPGDDNPNAPKLCAEDPCVGRCVVDPRMGSLSLPLSQAEFNRLVVEHGPALYRMAYRMVGDRHEAEDIVQDTFRSAWKSRRSFEAERGERAWLA